MTAIDRKIGKNALTKSEHYAATTDISNLLVHTDTFTTSNPDVQIRRHEIQKATLNIDSQLPEGLLPFQELALSNYIYTGSEIKDSLGHVVGMSIPVDNQFLKSVDYALRDISDQKDKKTLLTQLLALYHLRNPKIVLTDLLDSPDLSITKSKNREQHLRIIFEEKGKTVTAFHLDHHKYEGNLSYGENGEIKPDTRGKLDWSGSFPYISGLKDIKGEEGPWTFDCYIGKTHRLNPEDPNSAFMLFAGFELDPPFASVLEDHSHDAVLEQFSGMQSLKKLGDSLRPRISVVRMDHPRL